ncbi:RQC-minor-2 family DNA-binding protein [Jeotgalibacillus sp. ET6]|uniref:RQC-minor-2 family DNA-binding protein n=1 Tax=Jeotgalibacillus sp. ET6 TaxID=3037260 RepID=UPI002418A77C|nr:RQC-minor-2 family DNA-binding protein [Jeotgalibacillus sp. ET6]MDG5472507.1 RQC-minor-2 family DNA-binding protein [Jeotgalibacillus sp. ET6]
MNSNHLGHQPEAHPSLLLIPAGRKHPNIRSIGRKEERAVLTRLQQILSIELDRLSIRDQQLLRDFVDLPSFQLPVPVCKQQSLCPSLLKPEMFLWKKHAPTRGLPLNEEFFYKTPYQSLSTRELTVHLQEVIRDYVFCAWVQRLNQNTWIERIQQAYREHPFIVLARSKQNVVRAVEKMNRSSLLGLLNYPEDLSYWRHRVEIVMRPYRSIPPDWQYEICEHEKDLSLDYSTESIHVTCKECSYGVTYWPLTAQLQLPHEVKMEQAVKRIATIERQFDQMALQSLRVITSLNKLRSLKKQLSSYEPLLEKLISLKEKLGESKKDHPALSCYEELKKMDLPEENITPDLISLAKVSVPDAAVLKHAEKWQSIDNGSLESELAELYNELLMREQSMQPQPHDVLFQIKDYCLTRAEFEKIKACLEETELTLSFHLLVQTLLGEATNKVRRLGLHETEIFGMLSQWPRKYITEAVKAQSI